MYSQRSLLAVTITLWLLSICLSCSRAGADQGSGDGLFPIKEFGKWGYINVEGQTVIACRFDQAETFSQGLAAIRTDSLWGFINPEGRIVIKPKYHAVSAFSGGLCQVSFKNDTGLISAFIKTDGSTAFINRYTTVSPFAYGRATAEVSGQVCVIDTLGRVVFNTHYPYGAGLPLEDRTVHVWNGDSTRYYDKDGTMLLKLSGMGHGSFSQGLARVEINGKACYINQQGQVKVNPAKPELNKPEMTCFDFSDGMAQVVIAGYDHRSGFIDTSGRIVIAVQYSDIQDFKDGLAAFWEKGKWGFIDKTGKVVIPPDFEHVDQGFYHGLCRVKQNHQWGYINHKGELVWKQQPAVEYTKLDKAKWDLDTLMVNQSLSVDKSADGDNFPRKQTFTSLNELSLRVDTLDLTVYADRYYAYKLYLINASKRPVWLPLQDGRIRIVQQAENKKGQWQNIEKFIDSFCGNSYYRMPLGSNEFLVFATPVYKGEFNTKLRFKLELANKQVIYSNVYSGKINYGQLVDPKDNDRIGISVWAN